MSVDANNNSGAASQRLGRLTTLYVVVKVEEKRDETIVCDRYYTYEDAALAKAHVDILREQNIATERSWDGNRYRYENWTAFIDATTGEVIPVSIKRRENEPIPGLTICPSAEIEQRAEVIRRTMAAQAEEYRKLQESLREERARAILAKMSPETRRKMLGMLQT
jgi:hypothetical protein